MGDACIDAVVHVGCRVPSTPEPLKLVEVSLWRFHMVLC